MSEYFKSAFSNLSSQLVGAASSAVSGNQWSSDQHGNDSHQQENSFVGQTVELKGQKIRIDRVIAEGGFGFVFKVRDVDTGNVYALKRLIASDKESREEIENEIQVLQDLNPHPHIMKFISHGLINGKIFLILSEFCGCGSLQDLKLPITNIGQISRIIYQTSLAIERMHQINLIHRDLKIENILFDSEGFVKLCDFGSATSKSFHPDHDWTPIQRSLVEDEMQRHTTPMYRPPEILDTYLHYPINTAMDIWALGCLIFTIKFGRHPFEDSAKLRIINCNYNIPPDAGDDTHCEIIKKCLLVDPNDRFKIDDVIKLLEDNFVDLKSPCVEPNQPSPYHAPSPVGGPGGGVQVQSQSLPGSAAQVPSQVSGAPGSLLPSQPSTGQSFGFSGFTRYLKDASNKVVQSVNQTVQSSVVRQDVDVSYLTSRLLVMSFPAEGLEYGVGTMSSIVAKNHHIEDVVAFFERWKQPYAVVNVSGRSYGSSKFGPNVKLFDGGSFYKETKRPPSIDSLVTLSSQCHAWMKGDRRRLLVIHCLDGKVNSAFVSCSFLLWVGALRDAKSALNLFSMRRGPVELSLSQLRYLNYVQSIGAGRIRQFHPPAECALIKSVSINGIPLFTKLRDGCRPFIEFYMNDLRISTTCTDYERLRTYNRSTDTRIIFKDLKVTCDSRGDIYLIMNHARSTIGSRMLQGAKMTSHPIFSVQFNLDFERTVTTGEQTLKFKLSQLDNVDELDRFPRDFSVLIDIEFQGTGITDRELAQSEDDPGLLFEDDQEFNEVTDIFTGQGSGNLSSTGRPGSSSAPLIPDRGSSPAPRPPVPGPKPTRPPPPRPSESDTLFFDTSDQKEAPTRPFFDTSDQKEAPTRPERGRKKSGSSFGSSSAATVGNLLNLSLSDDTSASPIDPLDPLLSSNSAPSTRSGLDILNGRFEPGSLDLLGGSLPSVPNTTTPVSSSASSGLDLLNDVFSTPTAGHSASGHSRLPNLMHPTATHSNSSSNSSLNSIHRNVSTPNLTTTSASINIDPISQLGSFASSASSNIPRTGSNIPRTGSNIPRTGSSVPLKPVPGPTPLRPVIAGGGQGVPRPGFQGTFGSRQSAPKQPDYSRSHFTEPATPSATGPIGPKIKPDHFEDLLGGFTKTSSPDTSNMTVGQLKKVDLLKNGLDPTKLKVMEWKENKTRNIRALLGSLDTVVWDGCKWQQVGMHQLVEATDVRRYYLKACLAVHPDKLRGDPNEELAKLIFVELNDAWSEFEKQFKV